MVMLLQTPSGSDDQIRARLISKYAGKLFTIRDFPAGTRLSFDADGKLLRGGSPGKFTLDGHIHVETVNMRPTRIEILGRRSFLAFNAKIGKLEEHPTQERLRLEFARSAAVEAGIDATLLSLEQAVKGLPPYWARLITGSPILETITDPETGETVPRASEAQRLTPSAVRRVTPQYPPDLKEYAISGSIVLRVIIDERGKTRVVEIVTPVGFGLDQAAIDAVHQWEYRPAQQNGQPVKVYVRVQINFNPPQ
jgi:TonB family protein